MAFRTKVVEPVLADVAFLFEEVNCQTENSRGLSYTIRPDADGQNRGTERFKLFVDGAIVNKQLRLKVFYGNDTMTSEESKLFSESYKKALTEIISAIPQLHVHQITSTVQNKLEEAYHACDDSLACAVAHCSKALSLMQYSVLDTDETCICAVQFIVEGYSVTQVREAVCKVIDEQPVMRSAYDENNQSVIEYVDGTWKVPILISEADSADQDLLGAVSVFATQGKRYIGTNRMLVKTLLFPAGKDRVIVRCYAHHKVWDGASYQIFKERVYAFLSNPSLSPTVYSWKTETNAKIEKEIHDYCRDYFAQSENFISQLGEQPEFRLAGVFSKEDLRPEVMQNPVEAAIRVLYEIANMTGYSGAFPTLMMFHRRDENNSQRLGLYADYMPVILPLDKAPEDAIEQFMIDFERLKKLHFSTEFFRSEADILKLASISVKLTQINIVFETKEPEVVNQYVQFDEESLNNIVNQSSIPIVLFTVTPGHYIVLLVGYGSDRSTVDRILKKVLLLRGDE